MPINLLQMFLDMSANNIQCTNHANHLMFLFQILSKLFLCDCNLYQQFPLYLSYCKTSLSFLQSSIYPYWYKPVCNRKINLLISWLQNLSVLVNHFFKLLSNFFLYFLLEHGHLHIIKLSLTVL